MKYLIASCILLGMVFTAPAQSLILTNHLFPVPKAAPACSPSYFYRAESLFTNNAMFPSNRWYYPTTNIITLTYTNPNVLLYIGSSFGASVCGKGSVSYTNPSYPQDTFKFFMFWGTNIANTPTNGEWVPITVTGIRTNGP